VLFAAVHISSPAGLVILLLYLGNASLFSASEIQFRLCNVLGLSVLGDVIESQSSYISIIA
jgi:hypothetical protein